MYYNDPEKGVRTYSYIDLDFVLRYEYSVGVGKLFHCVYGADMSASAENLFNEISFEILFFLFVFFFYIFVCYG